MELSAEKTTFLVKYPKTIKIITNKNVDKTRYILFILDAIYIMTR